MSEIKTFGSHLVDFSIIPDNGAFIDAGACQGNFIDDIKKHVSAPNIIAIEPNIQNYADLSVKYDSIPLIKAALVGIGEPKTVEFDDFNHIGLREWGNVCGLYGSRTHRTYTVKTITIRNLLDMMIQGPIHHLKMDIEGCEHKVIKDLTMEDAKRIQQISLEVHNGLQGMLDHLEKIGYSAKFENGELYAVQQKLRL